MEAKNILPVVMIFVLVGMIIGVGVLALDKFSDAAKTATTATDDTIAISSGTGSTTYDDVTALTDFSCINGSISAGNFTKDVDVNWTTAGVITVNRAKITDGNANVTYNYDADSAATTAIVGGRDEVSNVGTVWLGLIVTIVILAVIITIVRKSFGNPR